VVSGGAGGSIEQGQEIVAESPTPGTTPMEVARKHAISSGLLCTWRQQLLAGQSVPVIGPTPTFAQVGSPLRLSNPTHPIARTDGPAGSAATTPLPRREGLIEIVLPDGVTLPVDAQVDGRALRRVHGALEGR
jgi:transposase